MNAQASALSKDPDLFATVLQLPRAFPTVLGMGAHLKASLCLIEHDQAFVTHAAGDMESLEAIELYQEMLDEVIARAGGADQIKCVSHDLHPDFHSTRHASTLGRPTLPLQHHHAHVLATAMEYHHEGPIIGLVLDGFGLGPNNESWGGELLHVDGLEFQRLGHLSLMPQPGGDIAAREPWRMGAAALYSLGRGDEIAKRFSMHSHGAMLAKILDKDINCPQTSSCGRLFDAACGLLNVRPVAEFEGQAPMELEAMAHAPSVLENGWHIKDDGQLDCSPLLGALPGMDTADGANLFHGTLAAALANWVKMAQDQTGIATVAFGGGCFLNRVLSENLTQQLQLAGINVLRPAQLSPGDAGLSFGQAYAAALKIEK